MRVDFPTLGMPRIIMRSGLSAPAAVGSQRATGRQDALDLARLLRAQGEALHARLGVVVLQPEPRLLRIGHVRFVEQLERGLLPRVAQRLEGRVAAGARDAGVEHLDDEVDHAHRLGRLLARRDHVSREPVDRHARLASRQPRALGEFGGRRPRAPARTATGASPATHAVAPGRRGQRREVRGDGAVGLARDLARDADQMLPRLGFARERRGGGVEIEARRQRPWRWPRSRRRARPTPGAERRRARGGRSRGPCARSTASRPTGSGGAASPTTACRGRRRAGRARRRASAASPPRRRAPCPACRPRPARPRGCRSAPAPARRARRA